MTRISKLFALSAVAGIGVAAILVLAPAGRAAISPAPVLAVSYTAADLDHALGAFDGFRNSLDAAPARTEAPQQIAAIQGDRSNCARYTWPHIPQSCQTSASGQPLRQVRTVTTDTASR